MSLRHAVLVLRITVGLLLAAHGVMRWTAGTVDDFGGFLDSKGFVAGTVIAWVLTIGEIVGGLLMSAGWMAKWIALLFMIEISMGIILVHAKNGWFVVGHQLGGVEYSVLLLFALLVVAASDNKRVTIQ